MTLFNIAIKSYCFDRVIFSLVDIDIALKGAEKIKNLRKETQGLNRDVNKFNREINKKGNGVYTFVINGRAIISENTLDERDALGIWDTENFNISVVKNTKLLLIEVPI